MGAMDIVTCKLGNPLITTSAANFVFSTFIRRSPGAPREGYGPRKTLEHALIQKVKAPYDAIHGRLAISV